jgi:Ribbon-helix-helix domain
MEPIPFAFTPEQQGLLESLSRETGKPVSALIAQALEALQAHVRHEQIIGEANGSTEEETAVPQRPASVLDIFCAARAAIPEETWDTLPPDLATQHDHYIYGTPKRPA